MKIMLNMKLIEKLKQLFKKEDNTQIIGKTDYDNNMCENMHEKTNNEFSCEVIITNNFNPYKIVIYIYESINKSTNITTSLTFLLDLTSDNNLIYIEMYIKQLMDLHYKKNNSVVPKWIFEKLFDDIKKNIKLT